MHCLCICIKKGNLKTDVWVIWEIHFSITANSLVWERNQIKVSFNSWFAFLGKELAVHFYEITSTGTIQGVNNKWGYILEYGRTS